MAADCSLLECREDEWRRDGHAFFRRGFVSQLEGDGERVFRRLEALPRGHPTRVAITS
jgi:hypothetical protein